MEISTLGVIGAGQMGSGIAEVALDAGLKVILRDTQEEALQRARARIQRDLEKRVEKSLLSPGQRDERMVRLYTTLEISDLAPCQFVIEAAPEDPRLKREIFAQLEGIVGEDTIFASNTSSISITKLASSVSRPQRVIGMHFFNPVPVMKLVEIVRGAHTSDEVFSITWDLAQRMGKSPVEARDFPGFISSRLIFNYMNEGIWLLYEGLGSAEQIDSIMRMGANHPMGPLELADFVGLDTVLSVMRVLEEAFGERYRPCPLLVRLVEAGWLGRKVGKGIYSYGGAK
jgi:3-hydroxybutyryl-CoA dehydrogenase